MPKQLESGILYVAEEFGAAAHLCACGCGAKIRTPLGPTEWHLEEHKDGPSLRPSVGNWQQACQSHYWIDRGQVYWCKQWTEAQILAGRKHEQERRAAYFAAREQRRKGFWRRLWESVKGVFNRS